MKKAARLIVKGTVQGIFFRQFVKDHSDSLGLVGFVRNLAEGDTLTDSDNLAGAPCVEIIVEGEGEKIERLIGFVKKGPEHAQIRNVQIEERKWSGEFKEFKILRF